ncbi:fructose bisphosphate aldolase [Flavobacterium agrisoli]|uniref:fructose-bisphosphate aldolase n=1 Tax=Flavobacterium agrisoli TaxID=2793066 RepID=A0A934PMR6_9FLAO|nr:fructose bisphosphate aldolase [Flavobacterium agrisoli]MBK0369679.1 fructose bisphosphate aldolase [Flavobacterium agrisoli]
MKIKQLTQMQSGKGFIAALDQSGGSTPKALTQYGVAENSYTNDEEMYTIVHEMRTRIIKSPAFNNDYILGGILFENTMDRKIDGQWTSDYLWNQKGIVPFLKVDKGLETISNGVQLMKPIAGLNDLLDRALSRNIFGTKMRSVIKEANPNGIREIVKQQFEVAIQIFNKGLVPIIEPEVDIYSKDKQKSEEILKEEIIKQLNLLDNSVKVMLKLSIPTVNNYYSELMSDSHVIRVVALSGGYTREEANDKLAHNQGLIASFSRALSEGLNAQQSEDAFNTTLENSIKEIYSASNQ